MRRALRGGSSLPAGSGRAAGAALGGGGSPDITVSDMRKTTIQG